MSVYSENGQDVMYFETKSYVNDLHFPAGDPSR